MTLSDTHNLMLAGAFRGYCQKLKTRRFRATAALITHQVSRTQKSRARRWTEPCCSDAAMERSSAQERGVVPPSLRESMACVPIASVSKYYLAMKDTHARCKKMWEGKVCRQ